MDNLDHSRCPEYVVIDVPFRLRRQLGPLSSAAGEKPPEALEALVPVLLVTNGTNVEMPVEVIKWSRHWVGRLSYKKVRNSVAAIGKLYVFKAAFPDFKVEDEEDAELLVNAFLHERVAGETEPILRLFPSWTPVGIAAVEEDYRSIRSFAHFCRRGLGSQSPFAQALALTYVAQDNFASRAHGRQYFFSHLKRSYARWMQLVGSVAPFPSDLKQTLKRYRKPTRRYRPTLTFEQVCSVIDNEKNPVFKAIWIIIFFGGRRISEVLNLWCADVLDGHCRSYFSDIKCSSPLILICDPNQTTYTGQFSMAGTDRRDRRTYMLRHYGRLPRYETGKNPKARAGSKGFLQLNDEFGLSWITWITDSYHEEFYRLMGVIDGINRESRASTRHPYFFINSDRRDDSFGEPVRYSRVRDALTRAFARTGLNLKDYGKNTHIGRNFYTWYARNVLGVGEEALQLMLLHTQIRSQDDYGRDAEKVHRAVSKLIKEH